MPDYVDQERVCRGCRKTFIFTARDQQFFAERDYSPPNRCLDCRQKRRAAQEPSKAASPSSPVTVMYRRSATSYVLEQPEAEAPKKKRKNRRKRRQGSYEQADRW